MNTTTNTISATNIHELWEYVLSQIELSISPANFNTWFKSSSVVKIEDSVVYIGVPSQFFREWYLKKFHTIILKIILSLPNEFRNVEYLIVKSEHKRTIGSEQKKSNEQTIELPLNEYVNKNDNLNPRYTFDSFVIGSFNELAYTAAQAAINRPGITYNPLFVYGDTGRGKTHLIQAIGNRFKKLYPNRKVFYLTSEKFTVDYIDSLQSGTANRFKDKYRQYDLLIMDDVQFLSKKEKSQEELFHLFNTLYDTNKQIVFSSDRSPISIPDIANRLRSRFSVGMMIDIGEPDMESRVAIINKKIAVTNIILSKDVIEYIATSVPGSIRELEGVVNNIVCYTQTKGCPPDIVAVRQTLKSFSKTTKNVSVKHIVSRVADYYNIDSDIIYEKTRRREVVRPRQIIMYILREDFSVSYPTIGMKLGGRDHTTVIHSCEKVKKDIINDAILAREIEEIRSLLV